MSPQSARLDQLTLVDYDVAAAGAARTDLIRQFDAEVSAPPAQ